VGEGGGTGLEGLNQWIHTLPLGIGQLTPQGPRFLIVNGDNENPYIQGNCRKRIQPMNQGSLECQVLSMQVARNTGLGVYAFSSFQVGFGFELRALHLQSWCSAA
jgi:hypothetical protein